MSKDDTLQVLQARTGATSPEGWNFDKGAIYTITDNNNDVLNTTFFENSVAQFGVDLTKEMNKNVGQEQNFLPLTISFDVLLFKKIAMPVTTLVFVLIGVPLAITPPRVRYNRGFLFSIMILFLYYVLRALAVSFAESGTISGFLGAWLPNFILTIFGIWLYYKKVYTIN